MNRSLLVAPILLAACGHPIWTSASSVSPLAVAETFQCVDSVSKSLGYKPSQTKPTEGFLRTRKGVTGGLASVFDQLAYDQLTIEISPASGGAGSAVKATAESYVEQASRRGREQTERPSRPEVTADARTVTQACGAGRKPPTDRVPSAN